jgi:pimeloyl-ACP methyl ester carboxylesterase
MTRRLILFTGMGGDSRLMERIRVEGAALTAPDHEPALPAETLSEHAERRARALSVGPEDVVGGVSFGGMLAAQIAATRKTAGLILLGSCLDADWLPAHYRAVVAAAPLVPDVLLGVRSWAPLIRWRFAPIDADGVARMRRMAQDCPPRQLRTFGRMIADWKGVRRLDCPTLIVHGDRDRVIPIRAVKPDVVLTGAGHAFTLTHVDETNRALSDFVRRLS